MWRKTLTLWEEAKAKRVQKELGLMEIASDDEEEEVWDKSTNTAGGKQLKKDRERKKTERKRRRESSEWAEGGDRGEEGMHENRKMEEEMDIGKGNRKKDGRKENFCKTTFIS